LDLAPDWIEGHFLLAEWLDVLGRRDAAIAAYGKCLSSDPADRMGAILRLALLGAVATPPELPPAYVAAVFDAYAENFETALLGHLDYRVPAELFTFVASLAGDGARFGRALDLGCGTGLAGERLRRACAWMEGVDLSEGMIAVARRKALYDVLETGEAIEYLAAATGRYDLIVATDVLVYFGSLAALVAAAANALAPGGRLAVSVEAGTGSGYSLTVGHRYAHGEAYLRREIERAGLALEAFRETVCRLEAGQPLRAFLVCAVKLPDDLLSSGADPDVTGVSDVAARTPSHARMPK
jgi:predicted TPR repeat methyltransferase